MEELRNPAVYANETELLDVCNSFVKQSAKVYCEFGGRRIPIANCNLVGDLLEDIVYPFIKEKLPDFEEGPKQASPDFFGDNKNYEFELKVFKGGPGFDIGNFASFVTQLAKEGGVYRKLFNTKYMVFEYDINPECEITIVRFHYLPVYKLVSYSSKYPISMQVKRGQWYNIRPDSVKNWYSTEKTPEMFIDKIIACIAQCPEMENREEKVTDILHQFLDIKSKYTL